MTWNMRWPLLSILLCVATGHAAPFIVVKDTINPGTADFIETAIRKADADKAPFLLIELDTPGGLLSSTRQIVQQMLNSKTPIVVYVAPRGAQAGSAGALITLAADVAAMAPGTNIGAAHPVSGGGDEKPSDAMNEKITNDTAAFAESVAKTRGRNTAWAIKAVRESQSTIADEALKIGVIDLIAEDRGDLLKQLSAFKLKAPKHTITSLPADGGAWQEIEMPIRHRLVSFFANPNLAYLIMSLGGLCIWVEVTHPGLIFPGVLGAICIMVSLISFQLLPISYGALGLILAGMAMLVAELFLPTFGILGAGGLAAFVLGSLFLMETSVPEFQISLSLILPLAATLAGVTFLLGFVLLRTRKMRVGNLMTTMVGSLGQVKETLSEKPGKILVEGELWNAVSVDGAPVPTGRVVVVREVKGMLLVVAAQETGESA